MLYQRIQIWYNESHRWTKHSNCRNDLPFTLPNSKKWGKVFSSLQYTYFLNLKCSFTAGTSLVLTHIISNSYKSYIQNAMQNHINYITKPIIQENNFRQNIITLGSTFRPCVHKNIQHYTIVKVMPASTLQSVCWFIKYIALFCAYNMSIYLFLLLLQGIAN
jgi:hypothetical protein